MFFGAFDGLRMIVDGFGGTPVGFRPTRAKLRLVFIGLTTELGNPFLICDCLNFKPKYN
jgi:hypothetical protein